jgi:hypothetical protein
MKSKTLDERLGALTFEAAGEIPIEIPLDQAAEGLEDTVRVQAPDIERR